MKVPHQMKLLLLLALTGHAYAGDWQPKEVYRYGWQESYISGKQLNELSDRIRQQTPPDAAANPAYQKAVCTVRLAQWTFREGNTKGITEHLAAEALKLHQSALQNVQPDTMSELPGTPRRYQEKWALLAQLKAEAKSKQCAVVQTECAEVALAGAEYEARENYGNYDTHGTHHLQQAEQLIEQAKQQITACQAPESKVMPSTDLSADALFAFGQSSLSAKGKSEVQRFAEEMRPYIRQISQLSVTGHTDRIGRAEDNLKLSLQRAEAVKAELSKYLPELQADHITVTGKGSSEPVVHCSGNLTAALKSCLQPNRRVTINVHGLSF